MTKNKLKLTAINLLVPSMIAAAWTCPLITSNSTQSGPGFVATDAFNTTTTYTLAKYQSSTSQYIDASLLYRNCGGSEQVFAEDNDYHTAVTMVKLWDPNSDYEWVKALCAGASGYSQAQGEGA